MAGGAGRAAARAMAVHGMVALLLFLAAAFVSHPLARVHLILGTGVMPLILSAMVYFVPVLTRGEPAAPLLVLAPASALAGGAMAALAFLGGPAAPALFTAAAATALTAVIAVAVWTLWRAADCVGTPHPCLTWYLAALGCLAAGLGASLLIHQWADQYYAIKRLHLHLNTLGFVGMTAFGTLQVLMPTVAGRADDSAAERLRWHWPWALAGTVAAALSAGWWPAAGWLGALLWLVPVTRAAWSWSHRFSGPVFSWHGAAPLLGAALAGFSLSLLMGALHGGGIGDAAATLTLFATGFLFPLVAGALTHLLPLLLSQDEDWRRAARARLGRFNGALALLFPGSWLVAQAYPRPGAFMALAGLGYFGLKLAAVAASARRG
jgi:hypothetical protein